MLDVLLDACYSNQTTISSGSTRNRRYRKCTDTKPNVTFQTWNSPSQSELLNWQSLDILEYQRPICIYNWQKYIYRSCPTGAMTKARYDDGRKGEWIYLEFNPHMIALRFPSSMSSVIHRIRHFPVGMTSHVWENWRTQLKWGPITSLSRNDPDNKAVRRSEFVVTQWKPTTECSVHASWMGLDTKGF